MVRIVERSLGKKARAARAPDLESRRIVTLQGKRVKARLVDADSKSLGGDLLDAFGFAVERAIRQNKQLGDADTPHDDKA
ncbi:hypothetical protein [Sphingomonas sp. SRS2]|uniref:hypothetical protein n=1 Tax=Sphingomonas sp. SRS2 TaxID=133190 RepID=UPI000A934FBE|nr:hypothetical protein [Sphingomonas sp. SRS2]